MIRIEKDAWETMVSHAQSTYPNECCGAMLGSSDNGDSVVQVSVAMDNVFAGEQLQRYEIRNEDLLTADTEAGTYCDT